jgi:hypothetical protein
MIIGIKIVMSARRIAIQVMKCKCPDALFLPHYSQRIPVPFYVD